MKKIAILATCALMSAVFVACGNTDEKAAGPKNNVSSTAEDAEDTFCSAAQLGYDVNEHVSLGDYSNIAVTLDPSYEINDANINEMGQYYLAYVAGYIKSDEQEVKEDSIVNVDYTGYQDGEAFSGGTATDVLLDIANNGDAKSGSGFIPGFCSGLVGAKVGDEIDCDVTFPENYGVDSLNGQTVVFHFKVNYIAKSVQLDEVTDEQIAEYFGSVIGANTVEEYLSYMENMIANYQQSALREAVTSKIMEICSVDSIPDGYVDLRLDELVDYVEAAYCPEGTSVEDYIKEQYYVDLDTFRSEQTATITDEVKQELILEAIAKAEGIEIDEAEYSAYMTSYLASQGYETEDELYASIGKAEGGAAYFRQIYLENQVVTYLIDNAVVTYSAQY